MAVTQLSLYNGALMQLGETGLANLTETRESRYLLDNVWDNTGGLSDCLNDGFWKFAIRSVQWAHDPSVTPNFGLQWAFSLPTDYVRAYMVCSDAYFSTPLNLYRMEGRRYLYADIDPIFLSYVSNDTNYGLNLSNWTLNFTRYVECYFAWRIAPKVYQSESKLEALEKRLHRILIEARSLDAMEGAVDFPAAGSWVRSRWGRNYGWDRGNLNRLIG